MKKSQLEHGSLLLLACDHCLASFVAVLPGACRRSLLPETSIDECHSFHFITEDVPNHLLPQQNQPCLLSVVRLTQQTTTRARVRAWVSRPRWQAAKDHLDGLTKDDKTRPQPYTLSRSDWSTHWNNMYATFFKISRASCALVKSDRTLSPLIWTKVISALIFCHFHVQDVSTSTDMTL
jgi:hypothetical protein